MKQRGIKFRAWANGRMYVDEAIVRQNGEFLVGVWNNEETQIVEPYDDVTIMQFTGIKDKNGKEIYEHDILSSEYPREGCNNCHPVVWGDGRWIVDHSINDCCRPWRGDLSGHHMSEVVIGNIFQHPHLLAPKPVEDKPKGE